MVTLESVKRAQGRIAPYICKTPLLRLENMEEQLGCQVYAKMESFQRTNSFKARGALNRLMTLSPEALKKGIVTASSGNHGKATAYAAKVLGVTAHIVVPDTAPLEKVKGIRSYGADVIVSVPGIERFALAERLSRERDWSLISPFDDYEIMAGQGTAGLEILEQLPEVDTIIVPLGGGGLLSGLAVAVKQANPKVRVIGVEPASVSKYSQSYACGHPIVLPDDVFSVADGLQTQTPGVLNYPVIKAYADEIAAVDEAHILQATRLFLTYAKLLAEFSSCITLGAVLEKKIAVSPHEKVVFFISGGNIGMDQFKLFEEASS